MDPATDEHAFLMMVLREHQEAVEFVELLAALSQTWDDLIDRDKPVEPADINGAFMTALVRLPRHPFYVRHFAELQPVMEQGIVDWLTANQFEAGGDLHERRLAFVLKSAVTPVIIRAAQIVGGLEWAVQVAPSIRRFFQDESFEAYQKEGESHVR